MLDIAIFEKHCSANVKQWGKGIAISLVCLSKLLTQFDIPWLYPV